MGKQQALAARVVPNLDQQIGGQGVFLPPSGPSGPGQQLRRRHQHPFASRLLAQLGLQDRLQRGTVSLGGEILFLRRQRQDRYPLQSGWQTVGAPVQVGGLVRPSQAPAHLALLGAPGPQKQARAQPPCHVSYHDGMISAGQWDSLAIFSTKVDKSPLLHAAGWAILCPT